MEVASPVTPVAAQPVAIRPVAAARVLGMSLRKRRHLRAFLPGTRLRALGNGDEAMPGETVVVWASSPQAASLSGRSDLTVLRVEDGFLRSVGLGAQLTRPLSWVIDSRGIYYDPGRPSDLEHLLATTDFAPGMLARASRLRHRITAHGLSKYNVGNDRWPGLGRGATGREVVLVAGQVETDASIRSGCGTGIATNLALLEAARQAHPDAWLVYKPHPDVVAGLRKAGRGEADSVRFCDEVVTEAPISRLIDLASTVHVMTSLTGFEALLRDKKVHCHGLPFYAGWGLTVDSQPCPRRRRRLALDELVAGTLICYPRYVNAANGLPATPEQALDDLIAWRARDAGALRWWHRLLRPLIRHD